ncbi:hypothetical protein [Novosphingobium beihaiensis]|nr:hypothetical protein [Novosphingobium beihaiensis]
MTAFKLPLTRELDGFEFTGTPITVPVRAPIDNPDLSVSRFR